MPSVDVELPVLEALEQNPSISQRELADRAGLSLTRAHFVLRRLVEKGLVKVKNAAQSDHKLGYLYLVTPQGLEEKARLTYAFLERTAEQYQAMVTRVEAALDRGLAEVVRDGPVPVAIVGCGPLAEVVRDLVAVRPDTRLVDRLEEAAVGVDVTGGSGSADAPLKLVRLA